MSSQVLLITPPFTQLNTPYPATVYLKGFLNTLGISSRQADLGIETTLKLFTRRHLQKVFDLAEEHINNDDRHYQLWEQRDTYIDVAESVVAFLQGKLPALAHQIVSGNMLPVGERIAQVDKSDLAYQQLDLQDKAKHLATLYLEEIADFIRDTIDPYFGFTRYAERLARSANSFDALYEALNQDYTYVDTLMCELLDEHIHHSQPTLIAITAPFPGNVYAAFRCAQHIKNNYPNISIAFGGGFVNTELRSLKDVRVFEFFDFISLDDGEAPIACLWKYINGEITIDYLKRTFILQNNTVQYINNASCADYAFADTGTPDYSDLPLDKYIHAIEIINPMHNLWSNGRWNKLTMAHGCYWGKCTFCDVSLPYIADYSPLSAGMIVDRMESMIAQTGETGFHFVDEAAPPALMREVAVEILRRQLNVTWWTNIRFEKSFTRDLCVLLMASGCIGVSGGLEVASDRLLALIKKGVTVEQVAIVLRNFTDAGIMVHAYLMYGFPSQTDQETIDSLEIVRQLFDADVLQSAFWHRFAMTAHSPVGLQPEVFNVNAHRAHNIAFADNDVEFTDITGGDHEKFAEGLRISLYNYMQGAGLDLPLQKWFNHGIPKTTITPDHINRILDRNEINIPKATQRVIFLGLLLSASTRTKSKRGNIYTETTLQFQFEENICELKLPEPHASWFQSILPMLHPAQPQQTISALQNLYAQQGLEDFELFWVNELSGLYEVGLLVI
ncbi:MAG TPA: radical SAM protein [Chitinophagales bacterium]|nr:radical SAM protein [Chitinophagales bacterium]HNE46605.1 radical SAM protein [Chitinophagales bacterium]HNM08492.1 radical SAM protein [Chitinophagales bacterium]